MSPALRHLRLLRPRRIRPERAPARSVREAAPRPSGRSVDLRARRRSGRRGVSRAPRRKRAGRVLVVRWSAAPIPTTRLPPTRRRPRPRRPPPRRRSRAAATATISSPKRSWRVEQAVVMAARAHRSGSRSPRAYSPPPRSARYGCAAGASGRPRGRTAVTRNTFSLGAALELTVQLNRTYPQPAGPRNRDHASGKKPGTEACGVSR